MSFTRQPESVTAPRAVAMARVPPQCVRLRIRSPGLVGAGFKPAPTNNERQSAAELLVFDPVRDR
jgi:hypothetical protein